VVVDHDHLVDQRVPDDTRHDRPDRRGLVTGRQAHRRRQRTPARQRGDIEGPVVDTAH
jgi:hypothetical protein